jgi:hypothetical protein
MASHKIATAIRPAGAVLTAESAIANLRHSAFETSSVEQVRF